MAATADDSGFQAYVMARATLSPEEWRTSIARFTPLAVPARRTLQRIGQPCPNLYFLASGYLRFVQRVGPRTVTKYFTTVPTIVTSESFGTDAPSPEGFHTLSECQLWRIDYPTLLTLFADVPAWNIVMRSVLQEVRQGAAQLLLAAQHVPAAERYRQLQAQAPGLLQVAAVHEVASYLGIAPESLSRIRRNLR